MKRIEPTPPGGADGSVPRRHSRLARHGLNRGQALVSGFESGAMHTLRSALHRPHGRDRSRGQSLVEFAFVLPILLVMVAGAVDLGRMFYGYVTIESAAREASFYGASRPECDVSSASCPNPSNVTWRLNQDLSGLQGVTWTVQCKDAGGTAKANSACAEGDSYLVGVNYPFQLVTPILSSVVGTGFNISTSDSSLVLNRAPGAGATPAPTPTPTPIPTPTPTPGPTPTPCVNPTVTFTGSPTSGTGPFPVTFSGTSNGTPFSWSWTFGDGSTGSGQTVTHGYPAVRGTMHYDVTLTVNTGALCATTVIRNNYIDVR